jgi:selenocysteine lyase/cysteine desulfurase
VTEYSYLDAGGHVHLDYAGAGLPARAQLAAHAERIGGRCFGNPHSQNPASAASTDLVERARLAVPAHFNAPPEEYAAIFTPNATGACRLIGEAYPFGPRTRLVLTWDTATRSTASGSSPGPAARSPGTCRSARRSCG